MSETFEAQHVKLKASLEEAEGFLQRDLQKLADAHKWVENSRALVSERRRALIMFLESENSKRGARS